MDQKRPITKCTLYYKSVLQLSLMIGGGMGLLLLGIGMVFFFHGSAAFSEVLLLSIAGPLYLVLILIAVFSPSALRGLYLLSKQEQFLGFCFRTEMETQQISKAIYRSADWFIDITDTPTVIAVRRDFIVRLEKRKIIKSKRNRYQITLVGADGKHYRLKGFHASITGLQKWFRTKPETHSERTVTDDKTEN